MLVSPANARLRSASSFGPAIDSIDYDGQSKCSPAPKPGMLAFQRIVLGRYPGTGTGGISRGCEIGGRSEHKEGRAWDWGVNAAYESDRAKVQDLFDWLLAEDKYGNEAALAKRFGIMYIIWNRKIWGSWGGWSTYCVQKPRGCIDPDDKDLRHPHTDHVHFSMSWAGAKMQTTYWNPQRSMLAGIAAHPSYGYWELGANGSVASYGTGWYGSKSDVFLDKPAADIAPTATGYGYWIVTKGGRVFPFGDARNRGQLTGERVTVVDMEPTVSGNGYWLLAKSGRVFSYGDADNLGGAKKTGATFAGMASTPTGLGYWLFATGGNVYAYGDAQDFGGLADQNIDSPVVGGDNYGGTGYWLATEDGRVASFGAAPSHGSPKQVASSIVDFTTNASDTGYWLLSAKGKVMSFGEASTMETSRSLSSLPPSRAQLRQILGDPVREHSNR